MTLSSFPDVIMQIIQCFSMLLFNINKPTNIYYLLSTNVINETVLWKFDFENDEVVEYYISFLKSLALKITTNPIEFFFNAKYSTFPLLAQAIRFYNHKECMVRTSVRNITLTIFKMKNPIIESYIVKFPFLTYYVHLACHLKDLWIKLDQTITELKFAKSQSRKTQKTSRSFR
jgi:protein CLEC16A